MRSAEESTDQSAQRLPAEVWVLVVASFVIAIGFGILAPALPSYAASFDVGVTAASIVISAFAFMRLAFAPVSGKLVTRFGERPIYLIGILIVALSTGACAFADSYWQLLLFRALGGTGSTMFTVSAVALLVRLSPPHLRGRASGLWGTGFLLGNVIGPIFGGVLVSISLKLPFLGYAAALVLAAFVAWLFLRRSTLAAPVKNDNGPVLTVREALKHRAYVASLASSFANGWAVFGVRVSLIPLFVSAVLLQQPSMAGWAMTVFAVGNAAMLLLAGWLADRQGRKPLVLIGLVISAIGTIWVGFTTSVPMFLASCLVAGLGAGLLNPPQNAAVADVIGNRGRGGPVLAGFQMAADVGAIIGPLAAGAIAETISYQAAFAVTGLLSLLAALVWLAAPETLPSKVEQAEEKAAESNRGVAVAAECGCLDEGPEVPLGARVAGKPRQPEA
ncbi:MULTISPECIES: MFS transporter [unclassified Crossiella]|uniref:MFS transporter n=1 Tax=unclassified Crossiella TaxID=2620835 RepID=UPI001FFE7A8D|nr:MULTISPECIES: MFS transporter [unclassified Crossiella]MCK2237393.1 MFS transporter [Crossiella sp. S99.2]MCK2251048.1 MFS transporter [Crossiella sp. S99.1]